MRRITVDFYSDWVEHIDQVVKQIQDGYPEKITRSDLIRIALIRYMSERGTPFPETAAEKETRLPKKTKGRII